MAFPVITGPKKTWFEAMDDKLSQGSSSSNPGTSVITTEGDLIVGGPGGVPTRFPKGGIGQMVGVGPDGALSYMSADKRFTSALLSTYYRKWDPLCPPANPSALDDEFEKETLDPKWIQVKWGNVYTSLTDFPGKLITQTIAPSSSARHMGGLLQPLPLTGDWTVVTLVSVLPPEGNINYAGLALAAGATEANMFVVWATGKNSSSAPIVFSDKAPNWTQIEDGSLTSIVATKNISKWDGIFLRISRIGSGFHFGYSYDGYTWTDYEGSLGFTPTHVGLLSRNRSAIATLASFDFFRVYPTGKARTGNFISMGSNLLNPMYQDQDILIGGLDGICERLAVGAKGTYMGVGQNGKLGYFPITIPNPPDLTTIQSDIATLKTDVDTAEADIATLKTSTAILPDMKTDVTTLKTTMGEVKTGLSTVAGEVGTLKTSVSSLESSKAEKTALGFKADLEYVNTELAKKETKGNLGGVALDITTRTDKTLPVFDAATSKYTHQTVGTLVGSYAQQIETLDTRVDTLETGKADKTYVDTEVGKRALQTHGHHLSEISDYTPPDVTKAYVDTKLGGMVSQDSLTTQVNTLKDSIATKAATTEVNTELLKKAEKAHTHIMADIQGLNIATPDRWDYLSPTLNLEAEAIMTWDIPVPAIRMYGMSVSIQGLMNNQKVKLKLFGKKDLTHLQYEGDFSVALSSDPSQAWLFRNLDKELTMKAQIQNLSSTSLFNIGVKIVAEPF